MIKKELPVRLTDDEVALRGTELAEKVNRLVALEADAKEEAKRRKDIVDDQRKEVVRLSRIVTSKHESRFVECFEMLRGRIVECFRRDTGELVSSRPATSADMQGEMFEAPSRNRDEADA